MALEESFRGDGELRDAIANGVVDGIGDGGPDRYNWRFSNSFGTEGTRGRGNFEQDALDMRSSASSRSVKLTGLFVAGVPASPPQALKAVSSASGGRRR